MAAAGIHVLSLVFSGVLLKAVWAEGGCAIIYTNNKILAASFIYGMAFDFLVLCLTAWKLAYPSGGRSRLITLIFGDGLIYFLVAYAELFPVSLESGLTALQVFGQSTCDRFHGPRPQCCHVHHRQRSSGYRLYSATPHKLTSSVSYPSSDRSLQSRPPVTQLFV
jgi:hypothetical protein